MKLLFLGTPEDKPYVHTLGFLKQEGHSVHVNLVKADTLSEVAMICERTGATHVLCTQQQLIPRLCSTASAKEQTLDNYAGSWLYDSKNGITYVFVHPLKQCITKSFGQFLLQRFAAKITQPAKWLVQDEFTWTILNTGQDYEAAHTALQRATFIAIDIETRPNLSISSVSYTAVFIAANKEISTSTYVVPLPMGLAISDYQYRFTYIGKFNKTTPAKVLQNGKYDIAYFMRFGVPITNYLFDTMVCHHCWYSELPKTLDSVSAFYLRKPVFWKHEGDNGNDYDLYRYNALDTWYTAWSFLAWLHEAPDWAVANTHQEFPLLYPSILMEATGILADMEAFARIKQEKEAIRDNARAELGRLLSVPNFNPGSPKQVMGFLKAIGCGDLDGTNEVNLKKAAYRHPFNHFLIEKILNYRGAAKLVSTYLVESKIFNGRILYGITPYGTKTGRLSSQEHSFWTGLSIQTIPRNEEDTEEEAVSSIKDYFQADNGFKLGEVDYAQNESRTTGYITGDTVLIANVESDLDFHKSNASMFFGIAYEAVSKQLRQLAKPVNHGKNYLMGDEVLVDTMGLEMVFNAGRLLRLPKHYTAKMIAAYLGACFDKTYPVVSKTYPAWVKATVTNTKLLIGATGWVRYCFGNPVKSKMDLNAYVAHNPQSLAAMLLNKAVMRVYNEVWRRNTKDFKLHCQIHDSILFSIREGSEHLADQVKDCMVNKTEVTDLGGITRTMIVPADASKLSKTWGGCK